MSKENNYFSYEATGFAILCMAFYGLLAISSDFLSFDYYVAGGIILFVFCLEIVVGITKMLENKK